MNSLPINQPVVDRFEAPKYVLRPPLPTVATRRSALFARWMFPSRRMTWLSAPAARSLKQIVAAAALALTVFAERGQAEPMDNWTTTPVNAGALTWTNDLIFANGLLWEVGTEGKVQHSSDGKVWTVAQTPNNRTLTSITFGNGLYVATGFGMSIFSSPNGIDWTIREENTAKTVFWFDRVLFANGKFLTFSSQPGTAVVRISDNGINWTPGVMNGTRFSPNDVTWGKGLYVAVGSIDGTSTVQTSPDGLTWTKRSTSFTTSLECVTYFNGLFVAGGTPSSGPLLATSPDGITWTKVPNLTFPAVDTEFWGIKVLNGRVFAFGDYGLLMSSADGTHWTKHATGTTDTISDLDYDGKALHMSRRTDNPNGAGSWISAPWAAVGAPPITPSTPGDPSTPAGGRIGNLSTRAWVGGGDSQLISGFVINGTGAKKVLIRAVGPTLAAFGIQGALADPQLRVVNSSGTDVASNNDWGTNSDQAGIAAATSSVGAFVLQAGSKDAVALITLPPGAYNIVISGADGGTGIALAEVYDVDNQAACKLINIASRGFVGAGTNAAIPGFVITGTAPRKLLIRGVGPTLGSFGVGGCIVDPRITVFSSSQTKVAENDNWGSNDPAALSAAAVQVGAFALAPGSTDAALLVTVQPGAYTVVVSGPTDGVVGVGLVEIYELP
jgi:hypothetical protein